MSEPLLESIVAPVSPQQMARIELPQYTPDGLYARLLEQVSATESRPDFLLVLLQHALSACHASSGIYYLRDADDKLALGPRLFSKQLASSHKTLQDEIKAVALRVVETGKAELVRSHNLPELYFAATPVTGPSRGSEIMVLVSDRGNSSSATTLTILQLIAGFINLYDQRHVQAESEWETTQVSRFVEMVATVSEQPDSESATLTLINTLQNMLQCSHVALGTVTTDGNDVKIRGVSGLSGYDKRSRLTRIIDAVLTGTVGQGRMCSLPDVDRNDVTIEVNGQSNTHPNTNAEHQALHAETGCALSVSVPLQDTAEKSLGALLCWWDHMPGSVEHDVRVLKAGTIPVSALVNMIDRQNRQFWPAAIAARRRTESKVGPWLLGGLLLVTVAVMFLPVTHRVTAGVTVEPTVSRVVTAPFDGIIDQSSVVPGEQVAAEQVLAQLDGRELGIQLSDVLTEIQTAEKRRDVMMADGNTHSVQIYTLEAERLHIKRQLLEGRLANLDIKSPLAGVVVSGDLRQMVRSPVSRGQALFEVAPLQKMIAEVEVPNDQIDHVKASMPLDIRIDGIPDTSWQTELGEFRPRAEIRQAETVFVAVSEIDNSALELKPGMQGTAKISAGQRSLGWVLLHEPWEQVLLWLGISTDVTHNQ